MFKHNNNNKVMYFGVTHDKGELHDSHRRDSHWRDSMRESTRDLVCLS